MVLVALYDTLYVVLFSEENVSVLLLSDLTEWWERVVVLLLSNVLMVLPKGVGVLKPFLFTVGVLVLEGQFVLLLGFVVEYVASGNFLRELLESAERPLRIIWSFP